MENIEKKLDDSLLRQRLIENIDSQHREDQKQHREQTKEHQNKKPTYDWKQFITDLMDTCGINT